MRSMRLSLGGISHEATYLCTLIPSDSTFGLGHFPITPACCICALSRIYKQTSEHPAWLRSWECFCSFTCFGIVILANPLSIGLALVLLLMSFRSTERVLRTVYHSSPLAMAITILHCCDYFDNHSPAGSHARLNLTSNFQDSASGTGVLFASHHAGMELYLCGPGIGRL